MKQNKDGALGTALLAAISFGVASGVATDLIIVGVFVFTGVLSFLASICRMMPDNPKEGFFFFPYGSS